MIHLFGKDEYMGPQFNELKNKLTQEYEKLQQLIEKPNILIVGGTGAGKSSLINLCFGQEIAKAAIGKPVTQNLERFEVEGIPIVLFDTKGYELGSEKHELFLNEVVNYAAENKLNKEKQIHIVWYCIQAPSHRVLDLDIAVIKKFTKIGLPVAVVFTKCDIVSENEMNHMEQTVYKELPKTPRFQVTLASSMKYLDLDELCTWSVQNLPKGLQFAFVAAQKINMKEKREAAKRIVIQHSSASAFVGFTPIPFSDAPILLTNQTGMLVRILFIYEMGSLLPSIKGIIGTLGVPTMVSNTGVWLSGQLLKLIPGLGSIWGGIISASVAASLTTAIGMSAVEFCHKMYALIIEGNAEKIGNYMDEAESLFESLIQEELKKVN